MKRKTLTVLYAMGAMLGSLPQVTWGAYVNNVDPAYSVVVNSSTFTVKVTVTGASPGGSHYVNVSVKGSGGFSVKTGSQSITHLGAGKTQTLDFRVQAPSASASGLLTVVSKWSNNYSGSGTYLMDQRAQPISCNAGWKVNVQLLHPTFPLAGGTAVWTVTDSWRYSDNKQSSNAPYGTTFVVPATATNYTISIYYEARIPVFGTRQWSQTKTVYISKSGQLVTL
jgi:hypothetical protein